jgi:uncharacterized protein
VLLADTNIWLAAADRRSDRHDECAGVLRRHRGELAAPVPVIAETSWLILDRLGTAAQATFIRLITSGQLTPIDLTESDWQRCAELAEQYASLRLDFIDASLAAVAERLKLTTLATLNRRDFTVVRPRHAAALERTRSPSPCRRRPVRAMSGRWSPAPPPRSR